MKPDWHIITGEYPPHAGGVADYTRVVARALRDAGDEVHVWAPGRELAEDAGVHVHALNDGFGPMGLAALSKGLRAESSPRRLLVQYVPQAFGMKAMNVPFCTWLASRRDVDEVWVMFHEVALKMGPGERFRHNIMGGVQRMMAAALVHAAKRLFVSVPAWGKYLRSFLPSCGPIEWLPIPSNLPVVVPAGEPARTRSQLGIPLGASVIGHFGTYSPLIAAVLRDLLASGIQTHRSPTWLMLGRGGPEFVRRLPFDCGALATGVLSADAVAAHLAACDLVVQPFPDGVSSRRTSVMASLALGVPVITNEGALSEDLWRDSGAVMLADDFSGAAFARTIGASEVSRSSFGEKGRILYDGEFSLARTLEILRRPNWQAQRSMPRPDTTHGDIDA